MILIFLLIKVDFHKFFFKANFEGLERNYKVLKLQQHNTKVQNLQNKQKRQNFSTPEIEVKYSKDFLIKPILREKLNLKNKK